MTQRISPAEARRRIAAGATLIDVRDADEFARDHVPGSRNIPVADLASAPLPQGDLVFTCRSGNRTAGCAGIIADRAADRAVILDGGLGAWQAAGGPVAHNARAPLPIMRQVQIAAGTLVLAGILLSFAVHPGFLGLAAFVGAGLAFAGLSGWCGMALLLQRMPWNRQAA